MPFRSIVATPEELDRIAAAFEEAWSKIEARGSLDPLSVPGKRERLASLIAEMWAEGTKDDLVEQAVRRFNETAGAQTVRQKNS